MNLRTTIPFILSLGLFWALPSLAPAQLPVTLADFIEASGNQSGRHFPPGETERKALELAAEQLKAYNNRDIEGFLVPFSDDIEIYTFPDELRYSGKEEMRRRYSKMFDANPNLHCEITQEIVFKNYVLHREYITGRNDGTPIHALCLYVVEGDRIAKAYFF